MDQNETFINYGKIDVENILKIIEVNNLDWDEFRDRQLRLNGVHSQTKTIPIIFNKSFNFDSFKFMPTKHYPLFQDEISKLEDTINSNTNDNGKIIRAILVNLPSGKSIPFHRDFGETFVFCKRIHIPIQTNENCFFTVGDDKRNLKTGELWEINNDKKKHSVENLGEIDRIHLIVDWLEQSLFEKYDR